jgi:hypothetical protein
MTQLGDIITIRGRPERVVDVEMILRDGRPFYVALRSVPIVEEKPDDQAQGSAPAS